MPISPLEFRYGRKEVKNIFSEEARLGYLLGVEGVLAKTEEELGMIPQGAGEEIFRQANVKKVDPKRVKDTEKQIGHDIMAMVKELSIVSRESGKYVHLGATSNDISDTATTLQLKDFIDVLEKDLSALSVSIYKISKKHRSTVMMGRTHGQHALPITFGLKMAVYLAEMMRHSERLEQTKKRVLVGKFMGAVGTGAALGKKSMEVQKLMMKKLGIGIEEGPTQIVDRDRYVEYVSLIAEIASSLEKFATEIRNLQRPEIGELQEPFNEKRQVGSSTMAQKINPVISENIVSLARIIRGFLIPMHESSILWHERDLTNSAAERFIIPYVSILIDDILTKMKGVFDGLKVNADIMLGTVMDDDLILGEAYLMALINKGYGRQEAHEIVREASMEARKSGRELRKIIEKITGTKVKSISPIDYTGNAIEITDKILKSFEVARK